MVKDGPQEPPMACAVAEGKPVAQHVLLRGNPALPGEPVTRRFPTDPGGDDQPELPPAAAAWNLRSGWRAPQILSPRACS